MRNYTRPQGRRRACAVLPARENETNTSGFTTVLKAGRRGSSPNFNQPEGPIAKRFLLPGRTLGGSSIRRGALRAVYIRNQIQSTNQSKPQPIRMRNQPTTARSGHVFANTFVNRSAITSATTTASPRLAFGRSRIRRSRLRSVDRDQVRLTHWTAHSFKKM